MTPSLIEQSIDFLAGKNFASRENLINVTINSANEPVTHLEVSAELYNKLHKSFGRYGTEGISAMLQVMNAINYNYASDSLKPLFLQKCKELKTMFIDYP